MLLQLSVFAACLFPSLYLGSEETLHLNFLIYTRPSCHEFIGTLPSPSFWRPCFLSSPSDCTHSPFSPCQVTGNAKPSSVAYVFHQNINQNNLISWQSRSFLTCSVCVRSEHINTQWAMPPKIQCYSLPTHHSWRPGQLYELLLQLHPLSSVSFWFYPSRIAQICPCFSISFIR